MLEYEIEIGKEERDALLEITLQSDVYRKRRKVVTKMCIRDSHYAACRTPARV